MSGPYQVGQKLWLVPGEPRNRDRIGEVEVVTVGRRWLTLDNGSRLDINSLRTARGWGYEDQAYLNREVWEAHRLREHTWAQIREIANNTFRLPSALDQFALDQILDELCRATGQKRRPAPAIAGQEVQTAQPKAGAVGR